LAWNGDGADPIVFFRRDDGGVDGYAIAIDDVGVPVFVLRDDDRDDGGVDGSNVSDPDPVVIFFCDVGWDGGAFFFGVAFFPVNDRDDRPDDVVNDRDDGPDDVINVLDDLGRGGSFRAGIDEGSPFVVVVVVDGDDDNLAFWADWLRVAIRGCNRDGVPGLDIF